jgi:hypothetical protein
MGLDSYTLLAVGWLVSTLFERLTPPPLTQGSPLGASRPLLAVENPCQISYTAVHSTLVALSGVYVGVLAC